MKIIETGISKLLILEPQVYGDNRGYFFESFNQRTFYELGITSNFVQDNESFSTYGTLRGLHMQLGESAQAKLVRVIKGKVLDVAVDLRKNSLTFGQHYSIELSEDNKRLFYIPRGFAHGFIVMSETATFSYKCDNFYNPEAEIGIAYDDPTLKIDWLLPDCDILLSLKDKSNRSLKEVFSSL
jgi:dTDP-4-dehydrorhamnose 3,5-epimerase